MANYKFRFPSMVVAVIDLVMTLISIYLLVMFFFLAFTLSSCLFNAKDDCSSFKMGGGGLAKFGFNINFEQTSSSSYSHTVISSSGENDDSHEDNNSLGEDDNDNNPINNLDDFGKSFPGFGFDNKNRNPGKSQEVDLFGNQNIDFGKAFGNSRTRNTEMDSQPDFDASYGRRNRNQNQKPSGFEWFVQPNSGKNGDVFLLEPRADFIKFENEDEETNEKITGFMRVFFIIVVVILWIFFAIAVTVEIIMLVAAVRLLLATKEGKDPSAALRSANCWRICTIIIIILFLLNFFGGSGRNNLESVVVGGANVLFRLIGLIIVSLYIGELEADRTPQSAQVVYYDATGNGGQMMPMNQEQGDDQIGWNMPKNV